MDEESPREGGENAPSRLHPDEFRDALSELKADGCNLLVTGEVGAEVTDAMARRLLGASDQPRQRAVVLVDRTREDAPRVLPEGVEATDPDVAVVDHSLPTRDGTATRGPAGPIRTPPDESSPTAADRTESGVDHLQRTICGALVDLETEADGFGPAELRVALVTLQPLLDRYGEGAVERLVRTVRAHVAGVSGMAHYHLPLADDAPLVRAFAPLFDARIELRAESGLPPEQRWHLEKGTSPWIRM